ncbi:uncharacterized protein isoform X2 [Danio rerio]|uniref:Uncharacterized protein isoform X2 n=1 Tax=Danio rerio TaxID=7955 RepID=A0AC58ISH9_DANRE
MSDTKEESKTTQALSLVCSSDFVQSHPGDDAVLSCYLHPSISAVSMEIRWYREDDLSGSYRCEVSHEGQTLKKHIFLSVVSEDSNLIVLIGPISADPGRDVTLPVHLSPETNAMSMTIRWFKGKELIYEHRNGQRELINNDFENRFSLNMRELERGNVSLTLRNVQPSDSGQYTCRVFHGGHLLTGKVDFQVRGWIHLRRNSTEGIRPVLDGSGLELQLLDQLRIVMDLLRRHIDSIQLNRESRSPSAVEDNTDSETDQQTAQAPETSEEERAQEKK